MTNPRTYKGYQIHKQRVGPCGWNVADKEGNVYRGMTGFATLADAKEWINDEIERQEILSSEADS